MEDRRASVSLPDDRPPNPAFPSTAPLEDAVGHPTEHLDHRFMAEALAVAARIPKRPWPNPPVGAVVVRDGVIVGRGAHHGTGTDHAETVALREAGELARGATLYCTLEPCNHQGRTPPCAPALARAGIVRAVVAMLDPNPKVCGGGLRRLRADGLEVQSGVMAAEALELAWPFVASRAFDRPFVVLKTASTIDGFLAPPRSARVAGQPFYLTGVDARRDVHRLRRWSDVVLVGARTVVEDLPRLDGRLAGEGAPCPSEDPVPASVGPHSGFDAGWDRPHLLFTAGRDSTPVGARQARCDGSELVSCADGEGGVDLSSLVAKFADRGGHVLMVEGGPTLAAAFLRAGLVDRWVSYTAPLALGDGLRWPGPFFESRLLLTRVERIGEDVKAVWDRHSFQAALEAACRASEVQ